MAQAGAGVGVNQARAHRIAILGAESTGKSTLAAALAARYQTVWVPEYLREFVDEQGRVPFEWDQYPIAMTQRAREEEAASLARSYLFCDTTPLMTALYSRWYWQRIDEALWRMARDHDRYALTLVTAPDSPWEPDGLMRESEEVRQAIHVQLLDMLADLKIDYVLVRGSTDQRIEQVGAQLARLTRGG
jgi:NadR type nicotinamide-nucleotide adenylyltransferase